MMPQFTGEYNERGLPIYCEPVYRLNSSGTAYIPVAGQQLTDQDLHEVIGRYSAKAVQAERARCVAIVKYYISWGQPHDVLEWSSRIIQAITDG